VETVEHIERGGQHGGDDIEEGFHMSEQTTLIFAHRSAPKDSKKPVSDWVSPSQMTPRRRRQPLSI
jgi:hypothetical protein